MLAGVLFQGNFGVPEQRKSKKEASGWVIKLRRGKSPAADGLGCSAQASQHGQPAARICATKGSCWEEREWLRHISSALNSKTS